MAREIVKCERFCIPCGRVERSTNIDDYFENLNISGEGLGKELVDARGRLKIMSGWTSHFHQEISSLCDAIEQTMELICDPLSEFTIQRHLDLAEFQWSLTVETRVTREGPANLENLVFKMTRRKPKEFGEQWGKWRINRSEVEAAYSLSMLDFHEQERRFLSSQTGGQRPREDPESQNRTLRFLRFASDDIDSAHARCIYDWWISRESECFEVKDSTESIVENGIAPFRVVGGMDESLGWGVAVVSETALEKLCAQHIFSIFMSTASGLITSLPGEMTTRRHNGRNVGSFGISHNGVDKFAQVLQQVGLATLEEAYMSIIPPLTEKLPSILEVQHDILRMASNSASARSQDMPFWFYFTCHVTARTSTRNRKDLTSYILAGDSYFRTAVACMEILGEGHNMTLIGVRDLLRACKIVVFKAEKSESALPDDLADAVNWYRKVLDWVQEHGHHFSTLQNELFQVGLLKLIMLYRSRFGEWVQTEDNTHYSESQSFLVRSAAAVDRWNEEQEHLDGTWTMLEGNGIANNDWPTVISSALKKGYDAVSEILLESIPDTVALAVQMEYGAAESALLSVDKNSNYEQVIAREFTMRCASRIFFVDSENESGVTALCQAVISGERYLVESILDSHGANINKEDKKKRSPIFMAATLGHHEVFHLLLRRGAIWNAHHECGNTCLHVAASNGFEDILEALLNPVDQRKIVDPINNFGETPLHFAARTGNLFSIHRLHRMGASVDKVTEQGYTPLAYAVAYGNLAAVQALKEKGANLNAVNYSGESILQVATKYRHTHTVAELLRLGALPQWVCVQEAAKNGDDDIVEVLVEHLLCKKRASVTSLADLPESKFSKLFKSKELLPAFIEPIKNSLLRITIKRGAGNIRVSFFLTLGADPLSMDVDHHSALSLGARRGEYHLFALLMSPLARDGFVRMEPKFQEIPLRAAVESRNAEIVELLLDAFSIPIDDGQASQLLVLSTRLGYASVTRTLHQHGLRLGGDDIRSLLHTAVDEGSEHIIDLMDSMDICIKHEAEREFSLHSAARSGKDNIVSALLAAGVKADSHAQNGWTALQTAAQSGHFSVAKLLVEAGANPHEKNLYEWSAISLARAQQFTDIVDLLASVQYEHTHDPDEHGVASPHLEPQEDHDPWTNIFELGTGPIVVKNQEAELSFQLAPAIDEFPLASFELFTDCNSSGPGSRARLAIGSDNRSLESA